MASPSRSLPSDDAFARQLFSNVFQERVLQASSPIFPDKLMPQTDEIIDQALQRAYDKRAQYTGKNDTDLLAWVLVILRNLTRDILRSSKRLPLLEPLPKDLKNRKLRPETPDEDLGDAVPLPPISAVAWKFNAQSILTLASEADRDVLLLRLGHGLTVKETAEFLSTPGKTVTEAAVKMRLGRAIRRIKAIAQRLGIFGPRAPGHEEESGEVGEEE